MGCGVLCCAVLCCAVLCCAVVCCAVVCCGVLCCGVLWCAVVCCGVLWCAVVCCGVLCCAVVCCGVLSCLSYFTLTRPYLPSPVLCCLLQWAASASRTPRWLQRQGYTLLSMTAVAKRRHAPLTASQVRTCTRTCTCTLRLSEECINTRYDI
jgi:hypothetical protein